MKNVLYKIRRQISLLLIIAMIALNVDVPGAFAITDDGWVHKNGICYMVTKEKTDSTEMITVEAEGDAPGVTVTGIEKPDGTIETAEDGYAYAQFQAETNGTYDFKILITRIETATFSEATSSDAEKLESNEDAIATPSDAQEERIPEEYAKATSSEAKKSEYAVNSNKSENLSLNALISKIWTGFSSTKATPSEPEDLSHTNATELEDDENDQLEDIDLFNDLNADDSLQPVAADDENISENLQSDSIPVTVEVNELSNANANISIKWQDKTGNTRDDMITSSKKDWEDVYSSKQTDINMALNFNLAGDKDYPTGAVKIFIPRGARLFRNKNTDEYFDRISAWISVNNGYKISDQSKKTLTGTVMNCYAEGEDLILTNNAPITAGNYSLGTLIEYRASSGSVTCEEIAKNIQDMSTVELQASVYLNGELATTSNKLSLTYDSQSKLTVGGTKSYEGEESHIYYQWNPAWGTMPTEYPDNDYFYAWFCFNTVNEGDQDLSVSSVTKKITTNGIEDPSDGILIGQAVYSSNVYDDKRPYLAITSITDPSIIAGTGRKAANCYKLISYVVAYKKPESASNKTVRMDLTITGAGVDGYDESLTSTDYSQLQYKKPQQLPNDSTDCNWKKVSYDQGTALAILNDLSDTKNLPFEISGSRINFPHFYQEHNAEQKDTKITFIDGEDGLTLDGVLLNPEDYDFYSIRTDKGFSSWSLDVYGKYSSETAKNLTKIWEYKKNKTDDWERSTQYMWDIKTKKAIKMTTTGPINDVYPGDWQVSLILHPTDHVLNIIKNKDEVILGNTARVIITGGDGAEFLNQTVSGTMTLKNSWSAYGSTYIWENEGRRVTTDNYVKSPLHINFSRYVNPQLKNKETKKMTAYISLPKYMTLSDCEWYTSTECNTYHTNHVNDFLLSEDDYQISIIESGKERTMYRIDFDITEKKYTKYIYGLYMDGNVIYPMEAIKNYNDKPVLKAAWQMSDGSEMTIGKASSSYGSHDKNQMQTSDDDLSNVLVGYSSSECDFTEFENIDGNNTPNQIAVNQMQFSFDKPTTFEMNYQKSVQGSLDDYYSLSGSTEVGSTYRYRLKLSNSALSQRKDIILYDKLEAAYGDNEHWSGVFSDTDTSDFEAVYGIAPNIYYSTQHDLPDDMAPTIEELASDAWSTTCPADKTKVTAIAFDFGDFMLDVKQTAYVDIVMQAPARMLYNSSGAEMYAYNQTIYSANGKNNLNTDTGWSSVLAQPANVVKTKLVQPKLNIQKTANPVSGTKDKPNNLMIGAGNTVTYYLTVVNDSDYLLKDVDIEDILDYRFLGIKEVKISEDGKNYSSLDENAYTLKQVHYNIQGDTKVESPDGSYVGYKLKIQLPQLKNRGKRYYAVTVLIPDEKPDDDSTVANTAAIVSVNGKACRIESETTYHKFFDRSFNAGRGMKLTWTIKNKGLCSVFEKSALSVTSVPEGTELEIYRVSDCNEIMDKIYAPKESAIPLATISSTQNVAFLSPWMMSNGNTESSEKGLLSTLSGKKEKDGIMDSIKYDIVLYCKSGSMIDVPFRVEVTSTANQARNNFYSHTWYGFSDLQSQTLLDVK
ncbi:hypothetical protein DXD54_08340 [Clostridium sp. TM06-18]|nr:hypothetical protein [Clostridium sp. TM06-18]RHU37189.1 hypothetical protein DXD54_08340 [Clostridium sp. TM06-18]